MATHALNEVIRATYEWDYDGNLCENVLHFATDGTAVVQADVDALAAYAKNFFTVGNTSGHAIIDALTNEITLDAILVRTIDPLNPLAAAEGVGQAGSLVGNGVPFESAAVATFLTDLASRRGRGRIFIAGMSTGLITGGRLGTTATGDIQHSIEHFLANLHTDTGLNWVVWSPTNNSARDITGAVIRTILHHQRRRNS